MTAQQLIFELRKLGLIESEHRFSNALTVLASYACEAKLADGQRLNDATDFEAWLIELSREVRKGKAVSA